MVGMIELVRFMDFIESFAPNICQLEGIVAVRMEWMNEWTEQEYPANTKSGSFIIRKVMSLSNFKN